MNVNLKRKIRDFGKLGLSLLFSWLYIPHFICYFVNKNARCLINEDVKREIDNDYLGLGVKMELLYLLHNNRYFRVLFYHRLGPLTQMLIGWYRPGDKYFIIPRVTEIGGGAYMPHPYASGLNAKSIGRHFECRHMTTIGKINNGDDDGRPVIGNYVTLGANVTIVGDITIGNGVKIGAGSVVRTSIPPYAIVTGNPAKITGFTMTPEEIFEHEKALYPEEERLPLALLEKNYEKYFLKRLKEIKEFTRL